MERLFKKIIINLKSELLLVVTDNISGDPSARPALVSAARRRAAGAGARSTNPSQVRGARSPPARKPGRQPPRRDARGSCAFAQYGRRARVSL